MSKKTYGDLATGNSALDGTFGNEFEDDIKVEAISEQQHHLQELLPNVQYVIDVLDDEIEAISDIRAYIKTLGDKPDAATIQAEYRARELYIGLMERLKTNIDDQVKIAEHEAGGNGQ